jgi:hypothetical protein
MKRIFFSLLFGIVFISLNMAQTYQNDTIYTPNETPIIAQKLIAGEFSEWEKQEIKNYCLNYYDYRIVFISEATRSYNCHAYAWYITEGGDKVWINTPDDDLFWNDGSYILSSSSVGTKVSFPSDDHSAITTNLQGVYESKWGSAPVFRHTKDDCPYNSTGGLNFYQCNYTTIFANRLVSSNITVTACCYINIKNVVIQNNAKLTVNASETVYITGPFSIREGSQLEVNN